MKKTILSIFTFSLLLLTINSCAVQDTCDNGVKDGTETGIDCGGDCSNCSVAATTIQVDNQTVTVSQTKAEMANQFYISTGTYTVSGLGLGIQYYMSDGTTIGIGFYNDDVNASCVNTGLHVTDSDVAYAATTYRYGVGFVANASGYHLTEGRTTDVMNLTLCDSQNQKMSGNYDFKVEDNDGNEIHVVGTFTDVAYTKLF